MLAYTSAGVARRQREREERKETARAEAQENVANDPKGKNAKAAAAAAAAKGPEEEEEEKEEEIGSSPFASAQVSAQSCGRIECFFERLAYHNVVLYPPYLFASVNSSPRTNDTRHFRRRCVPLGNDGPLVVT